MTWTKQDAVLDAIARALERWDEAERRAHDLRAITKADVRRADRAPDGTRIRTPRRNALARYLTDATLTAMREWEQEAAAEPPEASESPQGWLQGGPRPWPRDGA